MPIRCPKCESEIQLDSDSHSPGALVDCPNCNATFSDPVVEMKSGSVIGDCELTQLLDRDAIGETYRATRLLDGNKVAIKILTTTSSMSEQDADRFRLAVERTVGLDCPNVVGVHSLGEEQGNLFLVTDQLADECLDGRLKRSGAMTEEEATEIVLKLARAMEKVWASHRLTHGDLRPGNIRMDEHGDPQLTNLGQASALIETNDGKAGSRLFGIPNYLSPERSLGARESDCSADIYSLGATLYHLVTGQMPFNGKSVMEVLRIQATEGLNDPRLSNPQLSEGLVHVVERMMARLRDRRYSNWQELVIALENLQAGKSVAEPALPLGESVLIRSSVSESHKHQQNVATSAQEQPTERKGTDPGRTRSSATTAAVTVLGVALLVLLGNFVWPSRPTSLSPASSDSASTGEGLMVAYGDLTREEATEFGITHCGADVIRRQFAIKHTDGSDLDPKVTLVISVSGSRDFSIIREERQISLANDRSTTFELSFTPRTLGRQNAIVSIGRTDSTQPPIALSVSGYVNPASLPAAEFANIDVVQNDVGSTTNSVTVTLPGRSSAFGLAPGSVRGVIEIGIGNPRTNDVAEGVPLASVRRNGIDHGQGEGRQFATVSIRALDGDGYSLVFDAAPEGGKVNMDCATVFFPFTNGWLAGLTRVAKNNAPLKSMIASPGLTLNPAQGQYGITDLGKGKYSLTLPGISSQGDGIILVNHGKDEGNYALSKAEADGSWTIFVHDNAKNSFFYERDPVIFVFIPKDLPGVISGDVAADGTSRNQSGSFAASIVGIGKIKLSIAGQNPESGVLIISATGGDKFNVDNVVSYEAKEDKWVVQTRDLPDMKLQDAKTETIFSFAFFPFDMSAVAKPADALK